MGGPGDAPHIVPVGALHRAVVLTGKQIAQIHPAHHPTGSVLFGGDFPVVDTGLENGAGLIVEIQRLGAHPADVVLRVQIILHRHGAGDAAHIQIALHRAVVGAVPSFAQCGLLNFLLGDIVPQIVDGGGVRVGEGAEQQIRHLAELGLDCPQIRDGIIARSLDIPPQGVHFIPHTADRALNAVPQRSVISADGGEGDGRAVGKASKDAVEVLGGGIQILSGLIEVLHPLGKPGGAVRQSGGEAGEGASGALQLIQTIGQNGSGLGENPRGV